MIRTIVVILIAVAILSASATPGKCEDSQAPQAGAELGKKGGEDKAADGDSSPKGRSRKKESPDKDTKQKPANADDPKK